MVRCLRDQRGQPYRESGLVRSDKADIRTKDYIAAKPLQHQLPLSGRNDAKSHHWAFEKSTSL